MKNNHFEKSVFLPNTFFLTILVQAMTRSSHLEMWSRRLTVQDVVGFLPGDVLSLNTHDDELNTAEITCIEATEQRGYDDYDGTMSVIAVIVNWNSFLLRAMTKTILT